MTTRFSSSSTHRAHDLAPYSTYASSTTTIPSVAPRTLDDLLRVDPCPERVVRVADPVQVGVRVGAGDLTAADGRRDAVDGIGRRVDRSTRPWPEEHLAEQQDEVVRPRSDDDVLGLRARVRRRGLAELPIRPVRIGVDRRHASRERDLRDAGEWWRVLVELQNGLRRQAVPRRDLGDRGCPCVRRELRADGLRLLPRGAHAATAAAWSGSPSARARGPTTSAARRTPSAVAVTTWSGFRNASIPRPPVERARPPVGRTCVAPAA